MNIYLGKRRTGQCAGFFFKKGEFVENRHKLDYCIESLFLRSKCIEQRIYFKNGGHRETKSFLRLIQHPADRVKLVLIDKALEEKIGRKLDRYLPYLFRTTFVLFPDVLQVFTCYQDQIIVAYHFGRISDHPSHSRRLLGKVQFKLGMIVDRISKFCLITFCNIKTVLV